jgi:ribose transport system substrate-binding protein
MKKKVVIVGMVILALMLMFSACTPSQPAESSKPAASSAAASLEPAVSSAAASEQPAANTLPGSGKKLAIMLQNLEDEFLTALNGAATARAEKYGFEVIFLDAKRDAATQASQIQDMITKKVDAIMLAPVDAAALSESVKLLNEANIPVTLVDRTVDEGNYVALSESDNVKFGWQSGQLIVDFAKKAGFQVADLKVLELQGDLASTSGRDRSAGFQQASKDLGFTIVSSLPTNWKSDVAYNSIMDGFQKNPDINAVFLPSDGVCGDSYVSALEQLSKKFKVGEKGHIICVGVDGTPGAIKYIKEGYIDATCAQPAIDMANAAVDKLVDAIEGKTKLDAKIKIQLPPTIATMENADSKELWANLLSK